MVSRVFLLLSFLALTVISASNTAMAQQPLDDYDTLVVTHWVGDDEPMTYDEWNLIIGKPESFDYLHLGDFNPTSGSKDDIYFCVLINSDLYPYIESSIDQYIIDLSRDGYNVSLYLIEGGTPEEFKAFLLTRYAAGMAGVVLIGDLPVPWFEFDYWGHEEFPCDLYYMDMDGLWEDIDTDGKYDQHSGDVEPEIWLGRLTASTLTYGGADEVALLQGYFDKNHRYRMGDIGLEDRGLMYVDDDWYGSGSSWASNMGLAYDSVVLERDQYVTTSYDYEDRLTHNYEFIQVCAHSSPSHHSFAVPGGGGGSTWYYEVTDIDPTALFYNLFACSNSRFTSTNYMGGWYIFCDTYGLGSVGSTKTGAMLRFQYFYEPFGLGENIGEAFADWFTAIAGGGFSNSEIAWHYGMTVCGDPTLVKDPVIPTPTTIWVDGTYGSDLTGDGTIDDPFETISRAITVAYDYDTIQVRPGLYEENLDYEGKAIVINGFYGADMTILEPHDIFLPAVKMVSDEGVGACFSGFTVRGFKAQHTVDLSRALNPAIKNNIFVDNRPNPFGVVRTSSVIKIDNTNPYINRNLFIGNTLPACVYIVAGSAKIINNTFQKNLAGLHSDGNPIAFNNIVTSSERQGFSGNWPPADIDYNDAWDNHPDYTFILHGPNNISENPMYIKPGESWFHLAHNSPCIDRGHPHESYLDPDGTRNDMGAFHAVYVISDGANNIQGAIDHGNGSDIIVYPGSYEENIDFHGYSSKLMTRGGPDSTKLYPANPEDAVIKMEHGEDETSMFSGFTVTECRAVFSFRIDDGAAPLIKDNIFTYNRGDLGSRSSGVIRTMDNTSPIITRNLFLRNNEIACIWNLGARTEVVNNTFDANYRGIFTGVQGKAKNNIITDSYEYGVYGNWDELDYNNVWHNHPDYSNAIPGHYSISEDPLYYPDYTLRFGSPCINTGDPGLRYLDPDGTRNDMGAYPFTLFGEPGPKTTVALPLTWDLGQNYPNPFNPTTAIQFTVPTTGPISLSVFNILGQNVRSLIDGDMETGRHNIIWDGRDNEGRQVASGIYFYRLESSVFNESKKMILLK